MRFAVRADCRDDTMGCHARRNRVETDICPQDQQGIYTGDPVIAIHVSIGQSKTDGSQCQQSNEN
jgi:hypothetical protein